MKKVEMTPFGKGQEIWFTIGRLKMVEEILDKSIGEIMVDSNKLSIGNLVAFLRAGMVQNGNRNEYYYLDKIDDALENGYTLADIQMCVLKAIVGSGILGEQYYYQLYPNELTEEKKKELERKSSLEKN